jgi:glutathione S-transferase
MPINPGADIEVLTLDRVPPMAQGYVKDLRVRWALEEAGLSYRESFLPGVIGGDKGSAHLESQPFGQVPIYREAGLSLFESGAILLHVGSKDERLLPSDELQRARTTAWMFAALNSVEPFAQSLFLVGHVSENKSWHDDARDAVRPFLQTRLKQLSAALGDREWLEGNFTVGDLLMVDVLRSIAEEALISAHPNLTAYVERGTARPAFRLALAAQLDAFERNERETA